jgi:hypothetical protein
LGREFQRRALSPWRFEPPMLHPCSTLLPPKLSAFALLGGVHCDPW